MVIQEFFQNWQPLVVVAEIGEGVVFVDDSSNDFGVGFVATAGDGHDIALLVGTNGIVLWALPGAVVDLVGDGEAIVLLGEGTESTGFGTRHCFEVSKGGFALATITV